MPYTSDRNPKKTKHRLGLSLIELLACIAILGIVAAVILPRLQSGAKDCNAEACRVHQGTIEVQVQLWKRQYGNLPSQDLNDIGQSSTHFPDGMPSCPVDGAAYRIDSKGRIVGHQH
jgi:general secretion pathway protein G